MVSVTADFVILICYINRYFNNFLDILVWNFTYSLDTLAWYLTNNLGKTSGTLSWPQNLIFNTA